MKTVLSALLLSRDPQSLFVAKRTFQQYGIQTTTCSTSLAALDALKRRTFDLQVLDFDLTRSTKLLELQAGHGRNHTRDVIVLAEKHETMAVTRHQQVRDVLHKPFTSDSMAKALKAVYSLIFMQKRAAFRCAVRINVSASCQENRFKRPLINAVVLDLSQRDLCLKTETAIPRDAAVFVDLPLPGTTDWIHPAGKVIWGDPNGKAEVQFSLALEESAKLRNWLNAQCPWRPELMAKSTYQSDRQHWL